jgi:Asp-tRNA(Asn)/Glu-tRNA(Gln) amidotransferase A subunit family amidase
VSESQGGWRLDQLTKQRCGILIAAAAGCIVARAATQLVELLGPETHRKLFTRDPEGKIDIIVSPTLCLTPPLMSDVADADSHLRVNRRIVRNTAWVNYLGLCAITMPVGRDRAGMPVGLQLTAPAHAEEKLLKIALAAERVLGIGADRLGTPPLLAR